MTHTVLASLFDVPEDFFGLQDVVTWVNKRGDDIPETDRHLHALGEVKISHDTFMLLVEHFDAIIAAAEELAGAPVEPPEDTNCFGVIKYPTGVSMSPHVDSPSRFDNPNFVTVLVYLNDNYEGGELQVEDEDPIKPAAGTVVLVKSGVSHQSHTVTSGEKHIAVTHMQVIG